MAWTRDAMAARAARELRDGHDANLEIGIPTLVASFVPPGTAVTLQSENGMLGIGPFPDGDEITGVVDMRVADLAVFTIDKKGDHGARLTELAAGVTAAEVRAKTEAGYAEAQRAGP